MRYFRQGLEVFLLKPTFSFAFTMFFFMFFVFMLLFRRLLIDEFKLIWNLKTTKNLLRISIRAENVRKDLFNEKDNYKSRIKVS